MCVHGGLCVNLHIDELMIIKCRRVVRACGAESNDGDDSRS